MIGDSSALLALQLKALAASMLAGNRTGLRVRRRIPERTNERVEIGALVGCVVLALAGAGAVR